MPTVTKTVEITQTKLSSGSTFYEFVNSGGISIEADIEITQGPGITINSCTVSPLVKLTEDLDRLFVFNNYRPQLKLAWKPSLSLFNDIEQSSNYNLPIGSSVNFKADGYFCITDYKYTDTYTLDNESEYSEEAIFREFNETYSDSDIVKNYDNTLVFEFTVDYTGSGDITFDVLNPKVKYDYWSEIIEKTKNINLYTFGGERQEKDSLEMFIGWGPNLKYTELFTYGILSINNDLDLFLDGGGRVDNEVSLFIESYDKENNTVDLFTISDAMNEEVNLNVRGHISSTDNIELYTSGDPMYKTIGLFIGANERLDENLELYMRGSNHYGIFNLSIDGYADTINNSVNMSLFSGATIGSTEFFIDSRPINESLNLVAYSSEDLTKSINLILFNNNKEDKFVEMFVENTYEEINAKQNMVVYSEGNIGWIPSNDSLNLHIERENIGLFGIAFLSLKSTDGSIEELNLNISGGTWSSDTTELYQFGKDTPYENIQLYTHGF